MCCAQLCTQWLGGTTAAQSQQSRNNARSSHGCNLLRSDIDCNLVGSLAPLILRYLAMYRQLLRTTAYHNVSVYRHSLVCWSAAAHLFICS